MGSRIDDGETVAQRMGFFNHAALRQSLAAARGFRPRLGTGTVYARIDAGRWVADCPLCAGSEVVSKAAPVFFCLSCGMVSDSGRARVVLFPADSAATEALVADLPPNQRNWQRD